MSGAVLLWAALPPLDLWPLAWIAPVPWLWLVGRNRLDHPHPYRFLWLVGFFFWLAALHWLRLPHWATSIGWVAVSIYLGFYVPVFVGVSRAAVHRLRVPLIVAAPVIWAGLELARGHLLTGTTIASLGHTQYRWIELIQISDLAGAYGVSFVVMFAAACVARMIPQEGRRWAIWPAVPLVAMLAAVLVYGHVRMAVPPSPPTARIALIQGSIDSTLKSDPAKREEIQQHYFTLSEEALAKYASASPQAFPTAGKGLDLIVWPETMLRDTLLTVSRDAQVTPEWAHAASQFRRRVADLARISAIQVGSVAAKLRTPMLLGIERQHFGPEGIACYNSAAHVSATGELLGVYDKVHLVMFGEYVPFAWCFPWLQRLTPLPISLTAGQKPAVFEIGGLRIAPNICYESVLPHVIRRQVQQLARERREPDVLVNLTNDGWFWGSSELDMHLVCGVFRAVECRKPFLIAANTGFSAWIDGEGRILAQGPRRATGTLLAEVGRDPRHSWYVSYGDWPAGLCLAASGVAALAGLYGAWRRPAPPDPGR